MNVCVSQYGGSSEHDAEQNVHHFTSVSVFVLSLSVNLLGNDIFILTIIFFPVSVGVSVFFAGAKIHRLPRAFGRSCATHCNTLPNIRNENNIENASDAC